MIHQYTYLKEKRVQKGLTQKEIAEFLGVPTETYSNWERGSRKLPSYQVLKLAKFYKCSAEDILGSHIEYAAVKL